jgi:hypothetical protein
MMSESNLNDAMLQDPKFLYLKKKEKSRCKLHLKYYCILYLL